MICRRATDFTDLEMIEYYPKCVRLNMHGKICTLKKSFFMVYAESYDCHENQNIHKENDCKVYLRF